MSQIHQTPYGVVHVLPEEDINLAILAEIEGLSELDAPTCRVGLTGGSTPKAFYKWLADQHPFPGDIDLWDSFLWSCSDERHVSLDDAESNFGSAQLGLLDPLGFAEANFRPWPVYCDPLDAAARFNRLWEEELPGRPVFDLCFLGMGDDCHTASLFPGSPLLSDSVEESFAAVEPSGKGWRLTITPLGLQRCGRVVVTVTGEGKADAVREVFHGSENTQVSPVQVLKDLADKVIWLMDSSAAKQF
ncbi:MAG: 6-phosphogluconolactonase [Opitutales bacterium]|nr:6-phosphogluconolactonase [Opitutales bacterium]